MLLIDARVGVSSIHGFGLIAREFIPAGTRVWRFHSGLDRKISRQEFSECSDAARSQILWYAYWDEDEQVYVLSGDDDRFTNHSDSPNTANVDEQTVAIRDIQAGEEITWDYRPFIMLDFPIRTDSP